MSKIKSIEDWRKELIYYQKSVSWKAPNNIKYSLWSKVPHQNAKGDLVMVDNERMSKIYYDWISENKPELLEI
tara:strand:- start:117 stop:335 length:219 start_codon:yes stop_codon:yes gene_type:complete